MTSKPEARLQELGLTLPPPPKPMAKYKPAVLAGGLLYVSGHGPAKINDKTPTAGRVGADLTTEQGKECARAESGLQPELTDELKAELDRRLAAYEANPDSGLSWEQVVAHVKRRR